jgi:ApaG protein
VNTGSCHLKVTVDRLEYQADILTPPDKPHCFAYYISIMNEGTETVTIRGRKWVVTETTGEVTVVEGDGVVGELPILSPGQRFSYNSHHIIRAHKAMVQGSYLCVSLKGERLVIEIPAFELVVPDGDEVGYC